MNTFFNKTRQAIHEFRLVPNDERHDIVRHNYKENIYSIVPNTKVETVVDMFEKKINQICLYAVETDKKNIESVMFSIPYENEMFITKIISEADETVDTVILSEYLSMDDMFVDLVFHLGQIQKKKYKVLEMADYTQIYNTFYN